MSDVKVAVKEVTGEDVSNITEVLEQLGLNIEGTLKEKVHAAAMELSVSIFVEVCNPVFAHSSLLPIYSYQHLTYSRDASAPAPPDRV